MSKAPLNKKPSSRAILLENCVNTVISDNDISGFDIGVETRGGSNNRYSGLKFNNVREPYRFTETGPVDVRSTRISNDPMIREQGLQPQTEAARGLGWRRLHGPSLPVFCGTCKAVFPSGRYPYAGAYFTSWDNEETCPVCGNEHARVSEGIFDLTGEVARIISAPDFTHAMMSRVLEIAAAANANVLSPEQAIEEAERVSPPLASALRRALSIGGATLLMLFGSLAGWGSLYYDATSKTDDHLAEMVVQQRSQSETLTQLLGRFPEPHQAPASVEQEVVDGNRSINSKCPTTGKTPTETGSIKLKAERKPKARELRRIADQQRRRMLRGERHRSLPSEGE